jgi:hypothetical protein
MNYIVSWEIEVDAETLEEAAEEALRIQKDPASLATVFEVEHSETGQTYRVDAALEGTYPAVRVS